VESQLEPGPVDKDNLQEQAQWLEAWVIRQAPLLKLLTASPPLLFRSIERRCFGLLLWGHAEMRADRELLHRESVSQPVVRLFRNALRERHGDDLDDYSRSYWSAARGAGGAHVASSDRGPVTVLLVQRDAADRRAFEDLHGLAAVGLEPLSRSGEAAWRTLEDLGQRSLLQQAAILGSTEVLIGAVGAALAWLVVMRPGAQVLEWLPQGVAPSLYRCSEAWNADSFGMFGGLGRLASVDHACLRSKIAAPVVPERLQWSAARAIARDARWRSENLRVDAPKFARWVREAVGRARRTRPPQD